MASHVNLIPWNFVEGEENYSRPSRNRVRAFERALRDANVAVSIRETRGLEANAACGQLRNAWVKQPVDEAPSP